MDTLLFLEEFQLKESNEKQPFFVHLRENLDIFPDDIAKYKILPKIIEVRDVQIVILITCSFCYNILSRHMNMATLVQIFSSRCSN